MFNFFENETPAVRDASSPDRPKPLFLGSQLAPDFVNTRPLEDSHLVELLPDYTTPFLLFHGADVLAYYVLKRGDRWK